MSPTALPADSHSPSIFSLELWLVVLLPMLAIIIGGTLAFVAYTRGFTSLETPALPVASVPAAPALGR